MAILLLDLPEIIAILCKIFFGEDLKVSLERSQKVAFLLVYCVYHLKKA